MAQLLSGIITVTTAGTEVAGPATPTGNTFAVKAHPDNTDTVWVGNDGTAGAGAVSNATGFPLNPGEGIVVSASQLSQILFDADVSGEKVCWFRLN